MCMNKMKATDLKIGDWVLLADSGPTKIARVEPLICAVWWVTDFITNVGYDDILPIPLTEEILKKSGWKYGRSDKSWCSPDEELYVYPNNGKFDVYLGRRCPVQYVHELQHILWALRMEDTLKV